SRAPGQITGRRSICYQRAIASAARTDDHYFIDNERRTRHAPFIKLGLIILQDVLGPDRSSCFQVETIQNASRTQRENSLASYGGCGSRAFSGKARLKVSGVRVRPKHGPGKQLVTDNRFVFSTLFLGYGAVSR